MVSRVGHGVGGAGGYPTVRARIVSPAGIQNPAPRVAKAAPDNHFVTCPYCRVIKTTCSGATVVAVAVQLSLLGLYLPPVFKLGSNRILYRQDHLRGFTACVTQPWGGGIGWACTSPTIGPGVISAARIQRAPQVVGATPPNNHFGCLSTLPGVKLASIGAFVVLVAVQRLLRIVITAGVHRS